MMATGAAVDYSEGYRLHARASDATDAALLAASAQALVGEHGERSPEQISAELRRLFLPHFQANVPQSSRYTFKGYDIQYNPNTMQVTASVSFDYKTSVLGIIGKSSLGINVSAQTSLQRSVTGAMSMFLVVDKSGSMGWNTRWQGRWVDKIDVLKWAVNEMASSIAYADPNTEYVRIGAVAYDSYTRSHQPLTWGPERARSYVQRLWAGGGTNSSGAVQRAYNELRNSREAREHQAKNGQDPTKTIVFMTDGSNNARRYDTRTLDYCSRAKREGMVIYTVAFEAPWRGQQLLRNCASSAEHYFNAANAQQLIDAFRRIGSNTAEGLVLSR